MKENNIKRLLDGESEEPEGELPPGFPGIPNGMGVMEVKGIEGMKKLMKFLKGDDEQKIAKKVKAKPEWVQMLKELNEETDRLDALVKRLKRKRAFLWSTVQNELDDDRPMKIDEKSGQVFIYEDEED